MRSGRLAVAALGALLTLAAWAGAHEVRPAYLELRETAPDALAVLWKVPARGDARFGLRPVFPASCVSDTPRGAFAGDAWIERFAVRCPAGLDGAAIAIDGLPATMTDVLVRLERASGATQTVRLTPGAPAFAVERAPGRVDIARTYLVLGVEHILLGFDHLLFVLALLLLVGPTRRLVSTVTAFTVAHSLTLAAATLGMVRVPPQPVEATIALSIAFVAAELVHAHQGRLSLTERRPWLVAFVFGLLHGLGFAGALSEVGLPAEAIPLALLFFNLGVEVGQLLFIAAVLAVVACARRVGLTAPSWAWRVPAYAIGSVAAYWTLARVAGFWGAV
jgi:hydrogenase/urease accessory protein HupE